MGSVQRKLERKMRERDVLDEESFDREKNQGQPATALVRAPDPGFAELSSEQPGLETKMHLLMYEYEDKRTRPTHLEPESDMLYKRGHLNERMRRV